MHVAAVPWAGGGLRMVIYGREGTLVATGNVSSQRGEMLRVQGAKRSHELRDMPIIVSICFAMTCSRNSA